MQTLGQNSRQTFVISGEDSIPIQWGRGWPLRDHLWDTLQCIWKCLDEHGTILEGLYFFTCIPLSPFANHQSLWWFTTSDHSSSDTLTVIQSIQLSCPSFWQWWPSARLTDIQSASLRSALPFSTTLALGNRFWLFSHTSWLYSSSDSLTVIQSDSCLVRHSDSLRSASLFFTTLALGNRFWLFSHSSWQTYRTRQYPRLVI